MSRPRAYLNRNSPRPLFGLSISYPAPGIIERIGSAWDWFWIDCQHGELNFDAAVSIIRACEAIDRPGIVRVPGHDGGLISQLLDAGAAGIIAPMVETLEEAHALVQAAKFPPQGNRSFGGLRVATRDGGGYGKTANQDTVLLLQIESPKAAALADKMAAIDGVDGLFLGPDDMAIRKGFDTKAPKTDKVIGKEADMISRACKKHGKLNVTLAGNDLGIALAKRLKSQLVVGSGDFFLLQQAGAERIKAMWNAFSLGDPKP